MQLERQPNSDKMPVDPVTHLIAGGVAGAAGTTVTCPLEVVKTRLQTAMGQTVMNNLQMYRLVGSTVVLDASTTTALSAPMMYFRHMLQTEGLTALFKGLAPSLFGIIPTRALYFSTYSYSKQLYNNVFSYESPLVHLCSAVTAGILTSTFTSPIWVVKTQIQLDSSTQRSRFRAAQCVNSIYKLDGLRGFYRGLSASYAGTSETAIHFVLYEHIKKVTRVRRETHELGPIDYLWAAALAKLTASTVCYPHEVCRTRLRQKVAREKRKYHSFFQTLLKVAREEGVKGLYGGMSAHLLRVVPNTAIVFITYEACVKMIDSHRNGVTSAATRSSY